jgi:hypothetical protein
MQKSRPCPEIAPEVDVCHVSLATVSIEHGQKKSKLTLVCNDIETTDDQRSMNTLE